MRHRDEGTGRGPSRRLKVGVGAATVLLVAAFVVAALVSGLSGGRAVPLPTGSSSVVTPAASGRPSSSAELFVHVSGAVNKPGLIRLPPDSRVVDAVEAAGGFAEGADPAGLNLARRVHDGEQLRAPLVGEALVGEASASGSADASAGSALIDLNRATAGDLEALPRIGPALAQRIVDWRTANGSFTAITDLLEVTGIGQKLFDGLKDRVTV
ncbi:helix-hairpin-helix domain-containing protein [Leifsonia shinshuensis]|uniref:Helix-hairpin-helix domain-containing protein n=1 Tax=Leifsonia shinshuensis TaxID=150026 RepID=A0A7G6Y6W4_9MICO|nr:helix-hairpin-helix domain-containing protein [Leifsonia shinshuensis]QNE34229.1 helix-hairpin-helix domain-containing protein [Leifsonia shinshuensis]